MTAQECVAAAEAALEDADDNLRDLVKAMHERATTLEENVAVIEAQIKLGQAWRDLAALKSFETER